MKRIFLKRLVIFCVVCFACFLVTWFLSQGKPSVPDASSYRRLLYPYTFFILPILILGNFIYLFSCLLSKPLKTTIISLVLGLVGPLFLYYAIQTSKDPMAGMAMLGMVLYYAIASIITFVMLTLAEVLRTRLRK